MKTKKDKKAPAQKAHSPSVSSTRGAHAARGGRGGSHAGRGGRPGPGAASSARTDLGRPSHSTNGHQAQRTPKLDTQPSAAAVTPATATNGAADAWGAGSGAEAGWGTSTANDAPPAATDAWGTSKAAEPVKETSAPAPVPPSTSQAPAKPAVKSIPSSSGKSWAQIAKCVLVLALRPSL